MRILKTAAAGMLATAFVVASIAPSLAMPKQDSIVVADTSYRSDSFRHHFFRGQYNHGEHAGKPRFGSGGMHRDVDQRAAIEFMTESASTILR